MSESLTYAPTPPRDRVEVVWQGDDLDITLPPRATARTVAIMVAMSLAATYLCYSAVSDTIRWGLSPRLFFAVMHVLFGAFFALWVLAIWGQGRSWVRVTLRGELLTFEVPKLLKTTAEEYPFHDIANVSVGPIPAKRDSGIYLRLHRVGGAIDAALENLCHSTGDLEIVAAALREAIARRAGAGAGAA